ncbi:MAG: PilZ domain-containing protein [Vicinamibacterales bacterium]
MQRRLGDRRVRPRFEIVGDLWGTLDTVVGMPLLNVGVGGVLVHSPVPLTPQSVHHVAVSCDGQQTPTSVQVRHVRPVTGTDGRDFYLIGLEFLTMPTGLVAQIQAWMSGNGHQHLAGSL